ncbi:hypothetical protein [Amycolatopsis sp. PS_44_ISF1]|uniref:hypothetical protein n=1 Tax=Amycolatopsis sp. PS_44_ISF1 TaxID=2974917 RepID=UPI0028DD6104|nr:hypothetical protein [Amycolatopsis sp. PS_44_ISF1]MDT8910422.1 hypothetical protein [Amycolatopsis sp. PS_44_ISF1]
MYGWLWRHLPGPFAAKLTLSVVLVLGVVALLMFVIFPWIDPLLWFNEVAVDN